jgi:hypothetical protein
LSIGIPIEPQNAQREIQRKTTGKDYTEMRGNITQTEKGKNHKMSTGADLPFFLAHGILLALLF